MSLPVISRLAHEFYIGPFAWLKTALSKLLDVCIEVIDGRSEEKVTCVMFRNTKSGSYVMYADLCNIGVRSNGRSGV